MGDEDINNSPTEDERGALCWCCAYCGQNGFSKEAASGISAWVT